MSINKTLAQKEHKPVLTSDSQGFKYLLCVIEIYSKYTWVKTLTNTNAKILIDFFVKITKLIVDQISYGFTNVKNS